MSICLPQRVVADSMLRFYDCQPNNNNALVIAFMLRKPCRANMCTADHNTSSRSRASRGRGRGVEECGAVVCIEDVKHDVRAIDLGIRFHV